MKRSFIIAMIFSMIPIQVFAIGGLVVNYQGYPGPLFNETNLIPGSKITKSLSVTNGFRDTRLVSFKLTKGPTEELSRVVLIMVKQGENIVFSEKSLADIYSNGNEIPIGLVGGENTVDYEFIAYFDKEAGNDYQNKTDRFELSVGFTDDRSDNGTVNDGNGNNGNTGDSSSGGIDTEDGTVSESADEAITETTSTTNAGETKGVFVQRDEVNFWWWLIAFVLVATLIISKNYIKNKKSKK